MMTITLNNRTEQFNEEKFTVNELIKKKNFTFKLLVTKVNGKLVKRDERDDIWVEDGDFVEILHLISGG